MGSVTAAVNSAFERRVGPLLAFAEQAPALARACREMAERFTVGGRLLVFGNGAGATDAAHVAVEFVHPVTVGKRALPALSLSGDAAEVTGVAERHGLDGVYAHQIRTLGRSSDIALGLWSGRSPSVATGLQTAHEAGLLTIALTGAASDQDETVADHRFHIDSADPLVVKEGHVTAYHLLWELVQVFLDSQAGPAVSSGASQGVEQLYPFLYGGGPSAQPVLDAAADSALQKVTEIVHLRREVEAAQGAALAACGTQLAAAFAAGGTLYAFGNGGSSTDAHAVVHAFLNPPPAAAPVPALCLASDVAVLTALSNDVGFDVTFSRQLHAFGRAGDIAMGISTSGGSPNVLAALEEAHRVGMMTVGLSGYGGGRMAELAGLDHLFAVPSSSVHRVQEVQTTVYHVLWEATQAALASP